MRVGAHDRAERDGSEARVGLLDYVAARRAADKEHLYLGQAVHSGQHMVCTGLKALQTFEDRRTDLLGQQIGSENAVPYAGETRPRVPADVVDRLPIVTDRAEIIAVPSDPSS